MQTEHQVILESATALEDLSEECIELVVTSPPYPMIEMWDEIFWAQNSAIEAALSENDGNRAYELMHRTLDAVWEQIFRVLIPGGILCINIGDATRKIGDTFQLFPSHSRILTACLAIGFHNLPNIIWRKQTNAPNKFMGSGMLPPGAYVTLEHEHILVFRKEQKREFTGEERERRKESAYFWEERNRWFSDVWFDLKGTQQELNHEGIRERSGAFPFELVYRLINMYSVKGDTVLDPFLGTGTTTLAAMASERNSIGYEIDHNFDEVIQSRISNAVPFSNQLIRQRLCNHLEFVKRRRDEGKKLKNRNVHYGFPCVSRQERNLLLRNLAEINTLGENRFAVDYHDGPQEEFCAEYTGEILEEKLSGMESGQTTDDDRSGQETLFE